MTDYAKYLIPCEQRTPSQAAAKQRAADSWRKTSPLAAPVRQLAPSAYMGLKAR